MVADNESILRQKKTYKISNAKVIQIDRNDDTVRLLILELLNRKKVRIDLRFDGILSIET